MRLMTCVAVWTISVAAALGEDVLALRSSVETGWTSNATETPAGPADLFVEHDHELSLSGAFGPLALRGTLLFEQTRFLSVQAEDDISAAAGVEAALELGEGMVLRAGYAVTRDWIGEGLPAPNGMIGIAGGEVTHETLLELAIAGSDQQVSVTVDGSWRYPVESVISGLPIEIPPVRLDPEIAAIGVGLNWEKAAADTIAVLGRFEADFSNVPEDDQVLYARLPGTAGTVAGGGRFRASDFLVEVLAGASMVWPLIDPALRQIVPYLTFQSELDLGGRWTLAARAEKRVEIDDPLDPVASSTAEAEFSARFRLTDALSLSAALAHAEETGIFDQAQFRRTATASLRLDYALDEHAGLSLAALRKWVDEPGGAYEIDRFTLALNTQF